MRRQGVLSVLLAALLLLSFSGANLANASPPVPQVAMTACEGFGERVVAGHGSISVQNGKFCSTLHGRDTAVHSIAGTFQTKIPVISDVCAPSLKVDIYDRHGALLMRRLGAAGYGCGLTAAASLNSLPMMTRLPQAGSTIQVSLLSGGKTVVTTRHAVS
ncbi:hypothetical protein JNJ66_02165 [Candidatus Saccharibacteria bacterium]|nr:hypothetical protein [Candidatus Saccharibacteria bacterium]